MEKIMVALTDGANIFFIQQAVVLYPYGYTLHSPDALSIALKGLGVTRDELKTIRQRLGLSTVELARAMGYEGVDNTVSVTIRRYESGGRVIPP